MGKPSSSPVSMLPIPAMEQRDADEADVAVDIGATGVERGHRLTGEVRVKVSTAPFGWRPVVPGVRSRPASRSGCPPVRGHIPGTR